ncbi:MAG: hypothetical protein ACI91O_000593, partial [Candidatus Poriferisodalaceae bacterium]
MWMPALPPLGWVGLTNVVGDTDRGRVSSSSRFWFSRLLSGASLSAALLFSSTVPGEALETHAVDAGAEADASALPEGPQLGEPGIRATEVAPVVVALAADQPPATNNLDGDDAVVGGAPSGEASGWFVTSDGTVVAYGDGLWLGDMGHVQLNQPIVAMTGTPSGAGYWLVASDGGIFSFGDAQFHGSTGNLQLSRPIVDIATSVTGHGYWLVADDGGVFAFGDALYLGSMGDVHLNQPVVGISATESGAGYWLVAHDGGVFTFGDAPFHGSSGADPAAEPVVDIVVPTAGRGYWLVTEDGEVSAFGSAPNIAATLAVADGPVVGAVAHGTGLWLTRDPSRPTATIWQSGGLSTTVLEQAVRAIDAAGGIASVNHTGTVSVAAIHRRNFLIDAPTPGWQVPFTARAIDPKVSAAFVGGDVVGALERGEVVLSSTTAQLRGAHPGDVITFWGWDGSVQHRLIGAVVPDRRVASTEILFSIRDAASFGFSRPSSVWMASIDNPAQLEGEFGAIAATNAYVRWAHSSDPANPDSVLSTVRLKDILGEFEYRLAAGDSIEMEPAWVAANIAVREFPIIGRLRCNRAVFEDLTNALTQVETAGMAHLIDQRDSRRYGGCWVARRIRGSSGGAVSRHSWGLAVDINPSTNRWGTVPTM